MRAAGAEIGFSRCCDFGLGDGVQVGAQAGHVGAQGFGFGEAGADGEGDFGGGEFAVGFEEGGAVRAALAEDARAVRGVVEDVADLLLDEAGLFLDDDDLIEALREAAQGFGVDRPG